MKNLANRLRYASRDIIKSFSTYVKSQVDNKNELFIESGVDDGQSRYRDLFMKTLSTLLGFSYEVADLTFDEMLINSCVNVLEEMLEDKGYIDMAKGSASSLFLACGELYNTVESGAFGVEL